MTRPDKVLRKFMLSLVALVAAGVALVGAAGDSHAMLQLSMTDGTTTANVSDTDGDGVLLYYGSIGVFFINITSGATKPTLGTATSPQMQMSSFLVSNGTGTLTLSMTETGFSGDGSLMNFITSLGGLTDGTVTLYAYIDSSNTAFGTGTLGITGPYSITLVATVTMSAWQSTAFNAALKVPEPSSALLFGVGLVGLGVIRRKRRREPVPA
jgi:hypothetical protein